MTEPCTAVSERLEAARARDADRLRQDLIFALSRVPERGLIFSRPEVDKIAEALGGYSALRDLLADRHLDPAVTVDRAKVRALMETAVSEGDPEFEHADAIYAWEVLALLAELEQAERKLHLAIERAVNAEADLDLTREELRLRQESQIPVLPRAAAARLVKAESRLAKVPALVEALKGAIALAEDWAQDWTHGGAENAEERLDKATAALKAWEAK